MGVMPLLRTLTPTDYYRTCQAGQGGPQSRSHPEGWTVTAGKVRVKVNSREAGVASETDLPEVRTWSLHYVSPEDMKRPLFCLQEGHYLVGWQPLGGHLMLF